MSNVKVAVRVRPLTKREEEQGAKIVVAVEGDNIKVTNIKQAPSYQEHDSRVRLRQFVFDFCYWSADGSKRRFASQEMIYEDLGTKVLDAVFEGFNACVLAYGQSGSGKTYTMMGYNGDLGLTPRICQGLFDRMSKVEDKRVTFRTEVSFLEIYNERVGDLLRTAPCRRQRHVLRVREHPKLGPCVQDLSKHVVTDFNAVQALIERGIQNRSVAATKMHDHSSRSHAIFTINFTQARVDEELPSEVVSKIHLVDLAGSERATVHMSKIRLKEGANINKSLVALGGVICALAEKSMSQWSLDSLGSSRSSPGESVPVSSSPLGNQHRAQQPFIPYRDSVLTWLLKDSLGGNSKTIMVATISPASTAYNETINTLRYTQRAKRIVNKPIVNEDPNVKLIRELKAEIARLRRMLSNSQTAGLVELPAESNMPVAEIISRNQDKAQELTKMWIEKWHYFQKQVQELSCKTCIHRNNIGSLDGGMPYLVGVSDLPNAGVHIFYLKEGDMIIGNCTENGNAPDIILMGEKMATEHCRPSLQEGTATITPIDNQECRLNGTALSSPAQLSQNVVQSGKNNALQFVDPAQCTANSENANAKHFAEQHTLALPGLLTDLPSSDFLLEGFKNKTASQCSGLQVLENFNKILEMKFHPAADRSDKCPACSQSCDWANSDTSTQPKNSPDDSGIGDTEMSSTTEANLDLFQENDGFCSDAPDQRTSPVDPAPEYSRNSEGEEYEDWSDADDFSYFAFDDGRATLDEQQNVRDLPSETTGQGSYSQHIDYLALPMQSLGSRRLSPIQECDTRSPSPMPDQDNVMPNYAATSSASISKNIIPSKGPTGSELKFGIPAAGLQDSVPLVPAVEAQEIPSSSDESAELDGGISCDSLDADSLDDREENESRDSERFFGARTESLDSSHTMPSSEQTFTDSDSNVRLIEGGVDKVTGAPQQIGFQQEVIFRPESREKRSNSISAFPHRHTQASTSSDCSSSPPMAASQSTPMLAKSENLRLCDRDLRQNCGYSSSSEDELGSWSAGRNQRSGKARSLIGSSRTPSLSRFLRERSCDTYTSSSEDESYQHGIFGKPQTKSSKAKQRFEQIVLENKRKRRRKTAPIKGRQKACSPKSNTTDFVLPSARCISPPPLPKLEFGRTSIKTASCQTKDGSIQASKLHSSLPESLKEAEDIWKSTPRENNCFPVESAKATSSSEMTVEQRSSNDNQTCIPVSNGGWNQDLYRIVQSGTDSDSVFDHATYPDSLLYCDMAHGINSHQDLNQTTQAGMDLDTNYNYVKEINRISLHELGHDINAAHEDPVHDHAKDQCRIGFHDNKYNITSQQDLNQITKSNTDLVNVIELNTDSGAVVFHVNGLGSHQDLDKISQSGSDLNGTINQFKNHDGMLFCDNGQDIISDLNNRVLQIPPSSIDADRCLSHNLDLTRTSSLDENWHNSKQPERLLESFLNEDEIKRMDKCSEAYPVSDSSGTEEHSLDCSRFMLHQDPCRCSGSETAVDRRSDWTGERMEQEQPSTSDLDCSDLTFETRTASQDLARCDHPALYDSSNSKSEISQKVVGLYDGAMSAEDTAESLHTLNFMNEAQAARINSDKVYFDNPIHELDVCDQDSKTFELTCWSDIATGQHELSDQLHISMHSKPKEKGLFGSSSSIWGQSWPSCDSLTMVYMGPEWGSTETNMIASIQSLEDLNDSDFSEGHQEALESFVAKSMQSRQKESPKRFQNAVATPRSYQSSSDSVAFNNDCYKNSNETFTICSTDDPMVAIWERQYAEAGSVTNEPIAAGLVRASYADEWTKDTRPYKDLWTIHSYSIDDLQSHSTCLCKGLCNAANSCCNEAGNMSVGSTCTAEVSTQTESDSGIQTDATVQSDATQTSVMFSTLGTQSAPVCTNATSQTGPLQMVVHVQTDPVCFEAGSQTNPVASDSSSQCGSSENKGVQTVCAQGCVDAHTNTECHIDTSGTQTEASFDQEPQTMVEDASALCINPDPQSDGYVEIPTGELLRKCHLAESLLADKIGFAEIDQRENKLESRTASAILPDLKCFPGLVALDSEITEGENTLEATLKTTQAAMEAVLVSEAKSSDWEPMSAKEVFAEKCVKEAILENGKLVREAIRSEEGVLPEVEILGNKLVPEIVILDDRHAMEEILQDKKTVQEPLIMEEKFPQEAFLSEERSEPENLLHEPVVLNGKPEIAFLDEILASEAALMEGNFSQEMMLLEELSAEEKFAPEPTLSDGKLAPEAQLPSKMYMQNSIQMHGEQASTTTPDTKPLKQDNYSTANLKPASSGNSSGIQVPLFQSGIYIGFHGSAHQMRVLDMKISFSDTADNAASASLGLQQGSCQLWNAEFSENPAAENKCANNASMELFTKSQEVVPLSEKDFTKTVLTDSDANVAEESPSLKIKTMSAKSEAVSLKDTETVEVNEDCMKVGEVLVETTESVEAVETTESMKAMETTESMKAMETTESMATIEISSDFKGTLFEKTVPIEINEILDDSLKMNERLTEPVEANEKSADAMESIDKLPESEVMILKEESNGNCTKSEAVLVEASESVAICKEIAEFKVVSVENSLESIENPPESELALLADNYESLETNKASAESDEAEDPDEEIILQGVSEHFFHGSKSQWCSAKDEEATVCMEKLFEKMDSFQQGIKPCSISGTRDSVVETQNTCFCQDHNLGDADDREVALWHKPDVIFKESLMEYFEDKLHSLKNAVKASEIELREFSQRFAGNWEDKQISSPAISVLPEDLINQRPCCSNSSESCQLHRSAAFSDAIVVIPPTPEPEEQTLGRTIQCSSYDDTERASAKPTETEMPNRVGALSEDVKDQTSKNGVVSQNTRTCQPEVFSDLQEHQTDSKTSHISQSSADINSNDEEYYELPIAIVSHERRKHRSSSKGELLKPIRREHVATCNRKSACHRSAQRHCHKSAAKTPHTKVLQCSESPVKRETVSKGAASEETKQKSEEPSEVRQTEEVSRKESCSATTQGTSCELLPKSLHGIKCTCDLEEPSPRPVLEVNSDAEHTDEGLPEDIVQLLRECRVVRRKAWKEIALAHQQLSITHSARRRNACAVHWMESFEGS